jgi:hypothetical protein
VLADKGLENGFAPVLGELAVAFDAALIVRMPHHVDLEAWIGLEELRDLTQSLR